LNHLNLSNIDPGIDKSNATIEMVDCIAMDKTGVFKPETISVEGQKGKMQ